jgi:hypothetical protein
MERKRKYTQAFEMETKGMRLFERPECREKGNIKMGLKEIRWRVWNEFIWISTGRSGRLL